MSGKSKRENWDWWDISRIRPYPQNAKIHDDKQVAKIAESIKQFDWLTPIIVDKDGVIIAGHGRRLAALSLGRTEVPVVMRDDLTPEQVKAARLADNRSAIGDFDTELLQKELGGLDFDLSGVFDQKELDFLAADLAELNADAFVTDVEDAAIKQSAETATHVEKTDQRDVKIDKALGFKAIKGADERAVARFMAQIEAETKLPPAEAFVTFIKTLTGAVTA